MTGRHRTGWLLKWFAGQMSWVGYAAATVAIGFVCWVVGPRVSYAVFTGVESGILAVIIAGLIIDQRTLAAAKAHREAGEAAWARAAGERRTVDEMYRRMRATVEGEGPL